MVSMGALEYLGYLDSLVEAILSSNLVAGSVGLILGLAVAGLALHLLESGENK